MKITARLCPWTGRLFREEEYAKHLKVLRKAMREDRQMKKAISQLDQKINQIFKLDNFQNIEDWLNANLLDIIHTIRAMNNERPLRRRKRDEGISDVITVHLLNMRFIEKCETTHSAPRGQKTTGWRDAHVPEAGWKGRIRLYFEGRAGELFETSYLKKMGVNTGTGGGDDDFREYELTLFAKDFRVMARTEVFKKLSTP